MKKRMLLIPDVQSIVSKREYPRLMESELEELTNDLNPTQRRNMAAKLERWALQLRHSADVIEAAEPSLEITLDTVFLPASLAEKTNGMNRSEILQLAALWSSEADEIREALGVAVIYTCPTLLPICVTRN